MDLLYFILICSGMTQIIVYGSIFKNLRPRKEFFGGFGELFHCPMCMGFWVGLFVWQLGPYAPDLFVFEGNAITGLLLACLSSGTSYIINVLMCDNGIQINVNNGE